MLAFQVPSFYSLGLSTFIRAVGAVRYTVADPPLGNARVFGIAAAELVTGNFMKLVRLTALFVAVI